MAVLRRPPHASTSHGIHCTARRDQPRNTHTPYFCLFRSLQGIATDRYAGSLRRLIKSCTEESPSKVRTVMDYRVTYEHSLQNKPDEFIVHVPSQLVENIPANLPRALLPEYITNLILKRSPQIGKIPHLRILCASHSAHVQSE